MRPWRPRASQRSRGFLLRSSRCPKASVHIHDAPTGAGNRRERSWLKLATFDRSELLQHRENAPQPPRPVQQIGHIVAYAMVATASSMRPNLSLEDLRLQKNFDTPAEKQRI